MLKLSALHRFVPGSCILGDPETLITGISVDTRTLTIGDAYLALIGENHDGNHLLPRAKAVGASAVIAEHGVDACGLPGLEVNNGEQALSDIAKAWRALQKVVMVAVVGSNGKTTVTQMMNHVLMAWYPRRALSTQGNYNNHIGVPLMLWRLREKHAVAVVELGMSHVGEIACLAQIAAPSAVIINNTQREHLEFMHDLDTIAKENGSVIDSLPSDGIVVIPAHDPYAEMWRERAGSRRVVSFAISKSCAAPSNVDVWATRDCETQPQLLRIHSTSAEFDVSVRVPGAHNAHNALAVCCAALALEAPLHAVVDGVDSFPGVAGRMLMHGIRRRYRQRQWLIDDTYNANPDSVSAAIDALVESPGSTMLVLGEMAELGPDAEALHDEVIEYAKDQGVNWILAVGKRYFAVAQKIGHIAWVESVDCIDYGMLPFRSADAILVKGSRSAHMERVVDELMKGNI